jgi:hypothetical protein
MASKRQIEAIAATQHGATNNHSFKGTESASAHCMGQQFFHHNNMAEITTAPNTPYEFVRDNWVHPSEEW